MLCERAIPSCLDQSLSDYEIIVIDDGSDDNTVERLKAFNDKRIKILRNEINLGHCPARNRGIRQAKGQWLLMFDSDFELLPGTLEWIYTRTVGAPQDIGNMASSCRWDTGLVTPIPDVPPKPVGYEAYLAWINGLKISEYFNCFRKEVFQFARYPDGRAFVGTVHLDIAKRWKIEVSRQAAIIFHTDAQDRVTSALPRLVMQRLLDGAHDRAVDSMAALRKHGYALQKYAPAIYRTRLNMAATHCFLNGQRKKGLQYSLIAIKIAPAKIRFWVTLLLGLLGSIPLAFAKSHFKMFKKAKF